VSAKRRQLDRSAAKLAVRGSNKMQKRGAKFNALWCAAAFVPAWLVGFDLAPNQISEGQAATLTIASSGTT